MTGGGRVEREKCDLIVKGIPTKVRTGFKIVCAERGDTMTGALVRYMAKEANKRESRVRELASV